MKKSDFQIGTEYFTGAGKWRCTDVGSRVIVAIRIDDQDAHNLGGPPYSVGGVRVQRVRPSWVLAGSVVERPRSAIAETGKFLRDIQLEDGQTVHNAFFDRSFKESTDES